MSIFLNVFLFSFIVHERTTVEQFEMYINFKKNLIMKEISQIFDLN